MKALKYVLVLFTFTAFVLAGCSDKSQLPVELVNHNSSLEKAVITNYTFTDFPIAEPSGGDMQLTPGGIWQIKQLVVLEKFASPDPFIDGIIEHNLSFSIDAVTGEGPVHGSWILTPADPSVTGGGIWEGTYQGYRSKSDVAGEWILSLKSVGHGKGGTIDGFQTFAKDILTIRADGPTVIPTSWTGTGEGYYKAH